jgi:N-acetylglutamate synthase-like GNAT family acetyltransferase
LHNQLPPNLTIRHDFKPGDIECLTSLHGILYAKDYGWDKSFEMYVAGPLSEFAASRTKREKVWLVERDSTIAGSIAIVQSSADIAQLRWFLLHPDLRGRGIGSFLIKEAILFCREQSYRSIFLWTEVSLVAAARLYVAVGFRLTEEKKHEMWGMMVTEQRYDLNL